jgi:hypothetical protein
MGAIRKTVTVTEDFNLYQDLRFGDFLRDAYRLAQQSPDPSTQNGAYVFDRHWNVIGSGVNGLTHGMVVTAEKVKRPEKYLFMEHAERNSIYDCLYNYRILWFALGLRALTVPALLFSQVSDF